MNILQGWAVSDPSLQKGNFQVNMCGKHFFFFYYYKTVQLCGTNYLFWRRAGHQRCFSPTWLRRAEAPRLWASSMTPHGSCPGGAPVTATWKIEAQTTPSTDIEMYANRMKLCSKPLNLQITLALSLSLVACWETVNESVKLLLSESETHRSFDDFSSIVAAFFLFCNVGYLLKFRC